MVEWRDATSEDFPLIAEWNRQLIQDEGHTNRMSVEQLEERLRTWVGSGEYRAILFYEDGTPVAYAVYRESDDEVYLRQFFVVRERRRQGIGRRAMTDLFSNVWPKNKRWTVSALINNHAAIAFWRAMGYRDDALQFGILPRE